MLVRLFRERKSGTEVVPLDIDCGPGLRAIVISGPNAGGKTVALKTIGLVVLMDKLGLAVPCKEDTIIPDFSSVLVDIGDDQSIEESLSTFSSKVERLKRIMQTMDERSLVLMEFLHLNQEFLYQQDYMLFSIERLSISTDFSLKAKLMGTQIKSYQRDIKAVTYHRLNIRETDRGYEVNIVFDI